MRIRHLSRIALAVACSATVAGAAVAPGRASAAAPGEAILTVSPAHPEPGAANGKAYFVHSAAAGTTWSDQVTVANTNDVAIDAWVDPVDGITSARTGAVYTDRTTPTAATGLWVRPSVSSIAVAAHTQTVIGFTVTVPVGSPAGDHVAGIAFQTKPFGVAGTPRGSIAVTTLLRSVVAIQVVVPGPATFELHLDSAAVRAVSTTGTAGISLDMADVGLALGKPQLEIVVDGPAGYHRTQSVKLDTMLPGDRITDELLWPDALAPGDYRLSITEDGAGRAGVAFLFTSHLAAALEPTAPQPAAPVTAVPSSPATSWVPEEVAGGIGLLVVLALVVLRARRRRCLHCARALPSSKLVPVGEVDGCMWCAVKVHATGGGFLCRECLPTHVGPGFGIRPHPRAA